MQLSTQVDVDVPVSALLYEAVQFAVAVAEETGGAFDPTVQSEASVSYRDVRLNPEQRTIRLLRPLILDLGAVAKGFAVDLAARELRRFENFAIDAGGDLYLAGRNADGKPWSVGIRHPRAENALIDFIQVSDQAVCTSGDYERGQHILDARTADPAGGATSVTVVAKTAMLADALATAAFVLGPPEGIRLFERIGVEGIIFSPTLERHATQGMGRG